MIVATTTTTTTTTTTYNNNDNSNNTNNGNRISNDIKGEAYFGDISHIDNITCYTIT